MINKKYLKLLRLKNKSANNQFLYKIVSERIIDSLDLIKFDFKNILEIGINEFKTHNYLKNKFPKSKLTKADINNDNMLIDNRFEFLDIDLYNLKLQSDCYDLIISNFFLHLTSNFEDSMQSIHKALKSDGLFIAAIPDIDNLYQLVNSMYKSDMLIYQGAYQRTNSTIEVDEIISTLKKLDFHIPTVNKDGFVIEYSTFGKLLNDIRSMGLSYSGNDKKQNFENKQYFKILENIYREEYYNGNYILDIKYNLISAWKK
tara:strand:+ start:718 stop:1494 length:777 start_codon:yes stop_codon:yes gene_type:complete